MSQETIPISHNEHEEFAVRCSDLRLGVVRVTLVDDRPDLRTALRISLEQCGGVQVAGENGDRAMAFASAETAESTGRLIILDTVHSETEIELASKPLPVITILDITLPEQECFETALRLRDRPPSLRIVTVCGFVAPHSGENSSETGTDADSLVLKTIRRMDARNGEFKAGELDRQENRDSILGAELPNLAPTCHRKLSILTERQYAMFVELARGAPLKQAARALQISYKAADHLKQELMKKLQVHDRVDLVRIAIREGIVR